MTATLETDLEFEAPDSAGALVRRFDVARDRFDFPKHSEFWSAIERAHADGYRGGDRRIAIIDSGFDLSLARLRDRAGGAVRMAGPAQANRSHGTAVALLVTEVAPLASLDLYEVAQRAKPDSASVARAIDAAADSEASIINLSLGHLLRDDSENHQCAIRTSVQSAVSRGKVVVSAVGNYAGGLVCPAQTGGIVAVGLQSERRRTVPTRDAWSETAQWNEPSYGQSWGATFTIPQPDGVLGSSFAAPLATGLAALSPDPHELIDCRACIELGEMASELTDALVEKGPPLDTETVELVEGYFVAALKKIPRRHGEPAAGRCPACAFLTSWIFTNAGRFYIGAQPTQVDVPRIELAENLLRRALWLAPWSVDATANLGKVASVKARVLLDIGVRGARVENLLSESSSFYESALASRPGNKVYETALASIRAMRAA